MPYGLVNAPDIFQNFMHEVFRDFLHLFVIVYIDDILIFSKSNLKMDEGKVATITNWPEPMTIKELQQFLGFSNFYRRLIKNYSITASPLTSLLRGKPSLQWNPEASSGFQRLKQTFVSVPVLVHPNPEPFVVEVDASTTGVGAILSQQQGNPTAIHPCAFFLRKFSQAERNYDIGDRELLAI